MRKVFLIIGLTIIVFLFSWKIAFSEVAKEWCIGLGNSVRSLDLPYGIENSLLVKVEGAKEKISSSDPDLFRAAINKLGAFKNEVTALRGKFLTENQADGILKQADMIIDLITNTTAQNVGSAGGLVEVSDPSSQIYGASVSIPPGALNEEKLITIVEEPSPAPMPTNLVPAGPSIRFGPEGTIFNEAVTIVVPYIEEGIDENNLGIYTFDNQAGIFKEVPVSGQDLEKNLLYAQVNHFSNFQVASKKKDGENLPYFHWTILINVTHPPGKMAHMNALVVHPECTNPNPEEFFCIPDKIESLKVTGPGGFSYDFLKADYWFDVCNKTINEFYGKDLPYHWYYAHKEIPQDMESGKYTFTMKVDNKEISIERHLKVKPLPMVDRSQVEICRVIDQDGTCLKWEPADLFEGVDINKPLKVRWKPIFYEGGIVYYQVRIQNWMGDPPFYRSQLTTETEITIPANYVNRLFMNNATYIMRIWAFDDMTTQNSHNRSNSMNIRFATGNLSFQASHIFEYARMIANNFPGDYKETLASARVRDGLSGRYLNNNEIDVFLKIPTNNDEIKLDGYTSPDFWKAFTGGPLPRGEYHFRAIFKDNPEKEVYLRDYYYKPRLLDIPNLVSPINLSTIDTLTPIFSWEPVEYAKTYELLVEKQEGDNWIRIFTKSWINGLEFKIPYGYLERGKHYRWRIRAYDSYNNGVVDSRSNSSWWYFKVKQNGM